jgi:hypothetical protein
MSAPAPELGIVEALRNFMELFALEYLGKDPRAAHAHRKAVAALKAYDEAQALRAQPAPAEWMVWSNEHRAWWGPERCGYRQDPAQAGLYSLEEAADICRRADRRAGSYLPQSTPPETMCPASTAPTQAPGAAPEKQR